MRRFLIFMTLVAVVSDYLLHPFYPQFFEARFGILNPKSVGYYFAAICFMVMISFPFWAYVAKKRSELQILVYTQAIAGVLALYCYWTTSYINFWLVSLTMILFKASYLLVYPYILKISTKDEHPKTIGLLSVIVHLGGILGAVLGGLTVNLVDTSFIFLIMAGGDFVQMGMSVYLLNSKKYNTNYMVVLESTETRNKGTIPKGFILKIGLITLILYFSDFLIRPFFSRFWESISIYDSTIISGSIYAIPGFVALFALWYNAKRAAQQGYKPIISTLLIGALGLLLQGIPIETTVILGRIVYGWAIFQAVVRFDVLLFEFSEPETYALDYSKIHFFQNLGVLLSSFFVGELVDGFGLQIPFVVAFFGFAITLLVYYVFFKTEMRLQHKKIINT